MLRTPARCGSVLSLLVTFAFAQQARAQDDGAPLPAPAEPPPAPTEPPAAPPAAPPPSEPAPPATPPAEPPPGATPPPSTPPSASPPPSAPPSGAFPLPPSTPPASKPPTAKKPPPKPAEPPPAAKPTASPYEAAPTPPAHDAAVKEATRPPPTTPEPAATHPHEDEEESVDQFKIGPVVGVGIPSIISIGGTLKVTRFVGLGVNLGLIPKVQLDYYGKATLSYQHLDFYARIYPLGGGFFLQGGAGYMHVDGTLKSTYNLGPQVSIPGYGAVGGDITYNAAGSVKALMLTALIGYFYTTSIGFSIGVDAGAQIPIAPAEVSYSSDPLPGWATPAPGCDPNTNPVCKVQKQAQGYKTSADDSVRDSLEKIGRTVLPTLNLRIGWIL